MKTLYSVAGLNTENLKAIFIEPAQNTLQTWCLKLKLFIGVQRLTMTSVFSNTPE
jgi:hypothetical protein